MIKNKILYVKFCLQLMKIEVSYLLVFSLLLLYVILYLFEVKQYKITLLQDARRESLTDPASILLSSLTKRRKSDVASSRHEINATGGNSSGTATMNSGASRRTILTRRTTRRGLKMRNNGNSCPASSGW